LRRGHRSLDLKLTTTSPRAAQQALQGTKMPPTTQQQSILVQMLQIDMDRHSISRYAKFLLIKFDQNIEIAHISIH
jgi:hypothetical protein